MAKYNNCVVRPMRPADLAACAAIEQSAGDPWSFDQLSAELCAQTAGEASRLFVAEAGSQLVALAAWQIAAGEASLYTLTVALDARQQGIGRQLLAQTMQALAKEGATAFFLEVRVDNLAAIRLYESAGFAVAGRRKGFYQNPTEDALVMNCFVADDAQNGTTNFKTR